LNGGRKFLEIPKKYLETLQHLGLTVCQAKIYLITIQNGTTNAKRISEATKIAQPYVYKVIAELENKGLIERMIDKNLVVEAVPLQVGLSSLVRRKKKENLKITREAQKLFQDFKECENKTKVQDYPHQFIWISKKDPYLRKRHEEIDNAKASIDFVTSWKRFPLTLYTFGEDAEKALQRKVRIRVVTEKPPRNFSLPQLAEKLKEYPNYSLRYVPNSPLAVMGIFDGKRIILDTSSSAGLAECPALWSNNLSLLAAMQDYYEILWITAQEKPKYAIDNEQNDYGVKKLKTATQ
jgi:sugar-specific transcriptional regulator TrmB